MIEIQNFDFLNKRVLLRCDFNLSNNKDEALGNLRLQRAKKTIDFLKEKKAKIILLSHFDDPQKISDLKERKEKCSFEKILPKIEAVLGKIKFIPEVIGKKVEKEIQKMQPGDIILLENLRFEKGEEENDEGFAKELSKLGDVYINEAFSASHREHASIVLLPKFLPSFFGFNFQEEVDNLSKISKSFERPLVVIIGGVKISSKLKFIEKFIEISDHILFGGKVANEILKVKGIYIGKPLVEEDEELIEKIKKIQLTDQKIHLPVDVIASLDETGDLLKRITAPAMVRKEEEIYDIGPNTVTIWKQIISESKTVFWAGPLGFFENPNFELGTKEIASFIASKYDIFSVVGGGDTINALSKFNLLNKFSYVSTGGSAMLEFLSQNTLPGIEAQKNN
jgi:phosphoglycerate kinase